MGNASEHKQHLRTNFHAPEIAQPLVAGEFFNKAKMLNSREMFFDMLQCGDY